MTTAREMLATAHKSMKKATIAEHALKNDRKRCRLAEAAHRQRDIR